MIASAEADMLRRETRTVKKREEENAKE